MYSVIRQFYNGAIKPTETDPVFEENRKILQKLFEKHDSFIGELENIAPGLSQKFEDLMEDGINMLSFDSYSMFYSGFCLGSRLMLEVLTSKFSDEN